MAHLALNALTQVISLFDDRRHIGQNGAETSLRIFDIQDTSAWTLGIDHSTSKDVAASSLGNVHGRLIPEGAVTGTCFSCYNSSMSLNKPPGLISPKKA